jgi:glycine hydroxymethyltransferase
MNISFPNIDNRDPEISQIIKKETERQNNEIELIASENYMSPEVLEAMSSPLANKYSEGYPNKRYYGGNQVIDELENIAIERAKKLFGAEHVNVQSLSGSPANAAVYLAFLKPGDKVLGLKLDHGGHLSHGHPINFSGILYDFIQYELNENEIIDLEEVAKIAKAEKPKMIVAGFSAYSREIDWEGFAKIAKEVKAISFADISHTAGLIAAGQLKSPVPYFDVISTTTHKTLRGPRGAIIMCKEKWAKQIDKAVFPGTQGGPHNHITAAKAVALASAAKPEFTDYAEQVIRNAKTMANEFQNLGYRIVSGGTDSHLFIIDLSQQNLNGLEAEQILEKIGISVSRSTIPNDPNPPLKPSGIRIGTPAVTTRGFKEEEIKTLVRIIDQALKNNIELEQLKNNVLKLSTKFPIY